MSKVTAQEKEENPFPGKMDESDPDKAFHEEKLRMTVTQKKILVPKIQSPKKFWVQNMLVPRKFLTKQILTPKRFLVQKFFDSF